MTFEDKKIKCVACGAYLFDEDDVVFCPVCGAPHHRDCYDALGKCAMEDKHGTAEEYDFSANKAVIRPDGSNGDNSPKIKCNMCGAVYSADEGNCPSCGVPSPARIGRMAFSFDYLGGVPADLDLGGGVKADEAKQFVFSNTQRYIPKFAAFTLGKKTSFNWFSFLFPCGWFLSRKMIKQGALTGALQIALSVLLLPFYNVVLSLMPDGVATYNEVFEVISGNVDKIGVPAIACAFASVILTLVLRFVCGVFGDYFYKNHVINTISRIKTEGQDMEEAFRRKGGVNFLLFIAGVLITEYLPQIIYSFIV